MCLEEIIEELTFCIASFVTNSEYADMLSLEDDKNLHFSGLEEMKTTHIFANQYGV